MLRGQRAARGRRWKVFEPPSRPPPTSTNLDNLHLEVEAPSFGPMIAAVQGRDIERHSGDVVQQHAPPGELAHSRLGLHISLTGVADLDLARGLPVLGRQVSQILVARLGAEGAALPRDFPPPSAAPAPQPALPLDGAALRGRWPAAGQGTIDRPPSRRNGPTQ